MELILFVGQLVNFFMVFYGFKLVILFCMEFLESNCIWKKAKQLVRIVEKVFFFVVIIIFLFFLSFIFFLFRGQCKGGLGLVRKASYEIVGFGEGVLIIFRRVRVRSRGVGFLLQVLYVIYFGILMSCFLFTFFLFF